MKYFIGIDPSFSHTGLAIMDFKRREVYTFCFTSKVGKSSFHKALVVSESLVSSICNLLTLLIPEGSYVEVLFETPPPVAQFAAGLSILDAVLLTSLKDLFNRLDWTGSIETVSPMYIAILHHSRKYTKADSGQLSQRILQSYTHIFNNPNNINDNTNNTHINIINTIFTQTHNILVSEAFKLFTYTYLKNKGISDIKFVDNKDIEVESEEGKKSEKVKGFSIESLKGDKLFSICVNSKGITELSGASMSELSSSQSLKETPSPDLNTSLRAQFHEHLTFMSQGLSLKLTELAQVPTRRVLEGLTLPSSPELVGSLREPEQKRSRRRSSLNQSSLTKPSPSLTCPALRRKSAFDYGLISFKFPRYAPLYISSDEADAILFLHRLVVRYFDKVCAKLSYHELSYPELNGVSLSSTQSPSSSPPSSMYLPSKRGIYSAYVQLMKKEFSPFFEPYEQLYFSKPLQCVTEPERSTHEPERSSICVS